MRHEDGFTMVEVLVAAVILIVGVLTAFQALDSSRKLSLVAERQTTMAHRAQAELESVKSLPYSEIGLTATSASWSSSQSDPKGVNMPAGSCPGGATVPTYQPDHAPTGASTATEPLVINGCSYTTGGNTSTYAGGLVAPATTWTNGSFSGTVYDFVTYTNDPNCNGTYCPTTNDYKRITVVVTLNGAAQPSRPAIVSTFVADPSLSSKSNINQNPTTQCTLGSVTGSCNSTAPGTPNPFFPCDASYANGCSSSGGPACSGNTLNQTLVSTISGLLTSPAAPDAAGTSVPSGACTPTPPCYATDKLGGCQGLPLFPPSTTSSNTTCGAGPPLDNTKSHSWVGPAIPTGSSLTLTGAGAMTAYLESSSGVAVNAILCLRLYVVPNSSLGLLSSLLTTPISAVISANVTAQAGIPTPVTFPFPASAITAGTAVSATTGPVRIEFVVWIAGTTTPVEMVYDQAQFATEITLMTQ